MNIRAAIFDIYGTLLEVGPAPPQAEELWRAIWSDMFHIEPRLSRLEFSVACSRVVSREHEAARGRGIQFPEINWTSVVVEVTPELRNVSKADREQFISRHMRTGHSTRMHVEAAETLRALKGEGCVLGIASNAQAYTLAELKEALAGHGIEGPMFEPDLCFWSFQHGFSKPDPHVFQFLTARLGLRGIARSETIMVGDRSDNDIQPATVQGWRAWQLSLPGHRGNGGWNEFLAATGYRLDIS